MSDRDEYVPMGPTEPPYTTPGVLYFVELFIVILLLILLVALFMYMLFA